MLYGKKLMCLILLPTFFNPSTLTTPPSTAMQIVGKQVDNREVLKTDKLGLIVNPFIEKLEKDKVEFEQKKVEEERLRKEKELEEQKKNEIEWQEFIVSFYTGLEEENSIHGNVDCKGRPLERGVIANNVLPLGTKIFLEKDYGIRVVSDKGGSNFNSSNHIDMYVARLDGETRDQWKHRANSYGIRKIRGYIINEQTND